MTNSQKKNPLPQSSECFQTPTLGELIKTQVPIENPHALRVRRSIEGVFPEVFFQPASSAKPLQYHFANPEKENDFIKIYPQILSDFVSKTRELQSQIYKINAELRLIIFDSNSFTREGNGDIMVKKKRFQLERKMALQKFIDKVKSFSSEANDLEPEALFNQIWVDVFTPNPAGISTLPDVVTLDLLEIGVFNAEILLQASLQATEIGNIMTSRAINPAHKNLLCHHPQFNLQIAEKLFKYSHTVPFQCASLLLESRCINTPEDLSKIVTLVHGAEQLIGKNYWKVNFLRHHQEWQELQGLALRDFIKMMDLLLDHPFLNPEHFRILVDKFISCHRVNNNSKSHQISDFLFKEFFLDKVISHRFSTFEFKKQLYKRVEGLEGCVNKSANHLPELSIGEHFEPSSSDKDSNYSSRLSQWAARLKNFFTK